jgi:oligopeptide/dipeptide ABC transporter ATP-binding protein
VSADGVLLSVKGLCKTYAIRGGLLRRGGSVEAVRDLDLEIASRGSTAIVGESGSGKTTTARILVGLEQATAGEITLDGQLLAARPTASERRRRARSVQIVFQNPYVSLDPHQTARRGIEEILGFHLGLGRRERRVRALELLVDVGLGEREAEARPRSLSGGQCQRVAIARALAIEPRLLVLDEAVSALDVSVQAQILNLLADIRERYAVALLFISHDLAVVRQVADDVLVMYRGRTVERGRVDDVLTRPAHPYTQKLIASSPRAGEIPPPSPARDEDDRGSGCTFASRCPFVFDACAEEPPLLPPAAEHAARCWLEKD